MKHKVEISQSQYTVVEVEANSPEEAENRAEELFNNGGFPDIIFMVDQESTYYSDMDDDCIYSEITGGDELKWIALL